MAKKKSIAEQKREENERLLAEYLANPLKGLLDHIKSLESRIDDLEGTIRYIWERENRHYD